MKKIYVVTCGEYSDYGIEAIFDNKELAEKFISCFEWYDWHQPTVEEWELNPLKKEIKSGLNPFFVRMGKDGVTLDVHKVEDFPSFIGLARFDFTNNMYISCMAKDEKHAIKIANEKRLMLIAENKWGI